MARDILEHAPRLFGNVVGNDLAGLGIERDLAGAKEHRAAADGLRIRPDRGRRVTG